MFYMGASSYKLIRWFEITFINQMLLNVIMASVIKTAMDLSVAVSRCN